MDISLKSSECEAIQLCHHGSFIHTSRKMPFSDNFRSLSTEMSNKMYSTETTTYISHSSLSPAEISVSLLLAFFALVEASQKLLKYVVAAPSNEKHITINSK